MTQPPAGDRASQERVRRAADLLRSDLPPLPPDVDRQILASLLADRPDERRTAAPRRRATSRVRVVVGLAAAALVAMAVWGPSLGPLSSPDTAVAIPIAPLPADCARPAGEDRAALEVTGVWSGAEARSFARVLMRFEHETGIKVAYHYETRNMAAKLRARLAQGCPPDLALLPQPGLMADFARDGAIQPLDPTTAALVRRGYGPTWRRLGSVDGRLYGVWFKASDKSTLWYRPRALAAAGLDRPPATWAGLLRDGRRLARAGIRPLAVGGADGWTLTDWFENLYLRTAGARRYDQLARHEIPWTHPTVVAALARLGRLLAHPELVGDRQDVLGTTFEASVRQALGTGARAAMVYEADFVRSFIPARGEATAAAATEAPRMTEFPAVGSRSGGRSGIVVGGDVAVQLSQEPGTKRLLRFLATPRAAEAWARTGGFVSPNRDVPASAYADELTRHTALRLSGARTVRFDLSDLQPASFGASTTRGMWRLFQELAARPDAARDIARRLEVAATAANAGG